MTTYNARQAAHLLGVTEATVRKWITSRLLPATRNGREWEIDVMGLALMPRDRQALVAEGIWARANHASPEYQAWLTACWRQIAEAAFVCHGPNMANGCECNLCRAMAVLAHGYIPPDDLTKEALAH